MTSDYPFVSPGEKHRRRNKNFQNSKNQCLGKRDKSSAGRIDPKAVEICGLINQKFDCFYTTSSCAGRCFLYQGKGIKSSNFTLQQPPPGNDETTNSTTSVSSDNTHPQHSTTATQNHFVRFRVSHDLVREPQRYFNLSTIDSDPTGGGDPIRSIGQFDHKELLVQQAHQSSSPTEKKNESDQSTSKEPPVIDDDSSSVLNRQENAPKSAQSASKTNDKSIWLRFEPFILHVACRSLTAASALMAAARPAFKNVGLTTWTAATQSDGARYVVAIWGDEGLDMPVSMPDGTTLFPSSGGAEWLASLINERHTRNWEKIGRFVESVRQMPENPDQEEEDGNDDYAHTGEARTTIPKSYDVVGDICLLHALPESVSSDDEKKVIGEAIMKRNKAIKVVALRQSNLSGVERAPGDEGLEIIAGMQRSPLVTSHMEHGIKVVVDLNHTFFTPRMGQERLRICQQVARGEHVLVLFCGVGMDAMQIAGRTEASSVTAVEQNKIAVECFQRGARYLKNNKTVKCVGAAERLSIIEGDALDVMPTLPRQHYDRVLAPRPKEGQLDGDLGNGDGGIDFLRTILPAMKPDGGECHWYDFVSTNEFPTCDRTRTLLEKVCKEQGLECEIIHVANAGSVAMRQLRACIDFRIRPASKEIVA